MIFKLLIDQTLEIAIIIFHDSYKNSDYKLKLKIKQSIFYKTKKRPKPLLVFKLNQTSKCRLQKPSMKSLKSPAHHATL